LVSSCAMAAPAAADEAATQTEAAQSAVNKYGGCTINVEDDDYNGEPAWEVEIRESNQNTENAGRIEVKVDKSSGNVITESLATADSDDGEQCDDSLPSNVSEDEDSEDGNSDETEETAPELVNVPEKVTADEFEDSD